MRVLVAYETGHGSTEDTAEEIGEVMRQAGAEVEVERCRKIEDVDGYDAYVLGSPIWAGKWLRPARAFIKKNKESLADRPTAIFMASGVAIDDDGRKMVVDRWLPGILSELSPVEPVAIGNFAGVLNFPKYNIPTRLMMMAISKFSGGPTSGVHDFRDMEVIRDWARDTYSKISTQLE
ncbi:MAG: flavodoxin domain-containing protein [Armatimonadota bacterium]